MATSITLKQNSSTAGDGSFIYLSGAEFGLSKPVGIYVGGIHAAELVADQNGNLAGNVQIPRELGAGSFEVHADDRNGNTASAAFTVS